ncbi:hypothetical protein WMY93_032575 [Mugilogobius chulae]|uniref:Uncharacterized protein n=1 Tax=Mugilogobius chulae TaxID=88201 RepID=A0AAW0MUD8_9GOBI
MSSELRRTPLVEQAQCESCMGVHGSRTLQRTDLISPNTAAAAELRDVWTSEAGREEMLSKTWRRRFRKVFKVYGWV